MNRTNIYDIFGGRAQAVETTGLNQTKYNLKSVGFDTPSAIASGYSTNGLLMKL